MATITAALVGGPGDGRVLTLTRPMEVIAIADPVVPAFAMADDNQSAPEVMETFTKYEYRLAWREDESSYFYKFAQ